MLKQLHTRADQVDYAQWRNELNILLPIFDKDGTLTTQDSETLDPDVLQGLKNQNFAAIYPQIAIASNNPNASTTARCAEQIKQELSLDEVFVIPNCHKPHKKFGLMVSEKFNVHPSNIGVIGDRLLTDALFAHNFGARAIALCDKIGAGDVKYAPLLRTLESKLIIAAVALGAFVDLRL